MAELIERAKEIRDETRLGRNTASRVGGLLVDILEQLEGDGADDWFVERLKRHIDNDTVYWDDENKVIKAKGGGVIATFTITAGINAIDIGKCTITATGDVVSITPSTDGSSYVIIANAEGSVTVQIVPETGYQVQTLNVDKVSQGAVSEYTFENLDADHTMFVWMEEEEEVSVDFLERSDLRGTYYSKMQDVFNAVKASYPAGLTQDVTISCVKKAHEKYSSSGNKFLATLSNFNHDTAYVLTIDGANHLTINGNSLGGLCLEKSDNIILRNIDFNNCGNNAENYAPEETCAVYCMGSSDQYIRNIYVDNCRVDGLNLNRNIKAWYSVVAKCSENIYIVNSRFEGNNGVTIKLTDCRLVSLIKNFIQADNSVGVIGHPALCTCSNGYALIAEDNEFTGDSAEYYFSVSNVDKVNFRRNKFSGGRGRAMEMSSKSGVKELNIESNLFVSMLSAPAYGWVHEYFAFDCVVDTLNVINNTVYMGGKDWQQHFIRSYSSHVRVANLYNNIISAPEVSGTVKRGICLGKVDTINSGNNIYQFPLRAEGYARESFFAANEKSYITLGQLTADGLEANTVLIGGDVAVLEAGTYTITQAGDAAYPPDETKVAAIDMSYKAKSASGNSCGCINRHGTAIDEAADASTGYNGEDLTEVVAFDNSAQYATYADNVLMLKHKTLNRSKLIRATAVGSQHQSLVLGRYGLLHVLPKLNGDGEYVEDELYTINIE